MGLRKGTDATLNYTALENTSLALEHTVGELGSVMSGLFFP